MRKIIIKLFASSWYIFLTYIYDARSHLHQRNVVSFRVLNGLVSCLGTKYVKSLWIPTVTRSNTTHLVQRMKKWSHAHRRENLTQRFLTHPCQGDAGKGWAWTPTIQGCRETCPCICEHYQIRYTPQQALARLQPDQEAMLHVFRAKCNANGEV